MLQYSGLARQVGYWRRRSRYNGLYHDSIVGLAGKEIISQYSILYCDLGAKGNRQGCIAIQPLHLRHGRALCLRHGMGARRGRTRGGERARRRQAAVRSRRRRAGSWAWARGVGVPVRAGWECWLGQLGQVGAQCTWLSSDSVFGTSLTQYCS